MFIVQRDSHLSTARNKWQNDVTWPHRIVVNHLFGHGVPGTLLVALASVQIAVPAREATARYVHPDAVASEKHVAGCPAIHFDAVHFTRLKCGANVRVSQGHPYNPVAQGN